MYDFHRQDNPLILDSVFDNSPVGMAVTDLEWKFLKVNPSYCKITGYSEEQLLDKDFPSITHPDDREKNMLEIHEIVENKGSLIIEKRYIKPDGSSVWVKLSVSLIIDKHGKPSNLLAIAHDITKEKQAELKARENDLKFKALIENIPQIAWTCLPSGEVNFFNHRWYEYTGLSYEQSKAEGFRTTIHRDDLPDFIKAHTNAVANGNTFEIEVRKRGQDGEYRWFLLQCRPLQNEQGENTLWIGTATDIHDRKMAGAELVKLREKETELHKISEEQRQMLHALLMQVPALVCFIKGPEHRFEIVNKAYQNFFGSRELTGKKVREALPEVEGQEIVKILDQVYKTGTAHIGNEVPVKFARDVNAPIEEIYFNFIYNPTYNSREEIDGIFCFAYEVTEQVKARKVLEEYQQRTRMILESLPMIAWTSNANGIVDYFNPTWFKYTGMTPNDIRDWVQLEVVHPEDLSKATEAWKNASPEGKQVEANYRLRRGSDGMYRWHLGRSLPIRNAKGEIIKWVGTATDIHDQKTANDELYSKNKELNKINMDLDNFIYTASHDLKAPISNLEGLLNTFIDTPVTEEQRPLITMMFQSVERFQHTIKDLTDITHVQKGELEDHEEIDFEEITGVILESIKELVEKNDARIHTDFQVPKIRFSRKNLRSIIYNLISNAIKYRSKDKTPIIHIKTERKDNHIYLIVTDNGLGISPANQPKIFGMFKRLHDHVEGTGIGLYIVKRMVENAGGTIHVESEIGKGSTFKVCFKSQF